MQLSKNAHLPEKFWRKHSNLISSSSILLLLKICQIGGALADIGCLVHFSLHFAISRVLQMPGLIYIIYMQYPVISSAAMSHILSTGEDMRYLWVNLYEWIKFSLRVLLVVTGTEDIWI